MKQTPHHGLTQQGKLRGWSRGALALAALLLSMGQMGCEGCDDKLPKKAIPVPASPQALQGGGGRSMRITTSPSKPSKSSKPGVAGVVWRVPKLWQRGGKRQMRVATYFIPGSYGKRGECSVFHFGARGGSDQANIDRWRKQFRFPTPSAAAKQVKVETKYSSGIKITFVNIKGTFLWSARPMAKNKIPKPGYTMLGSIVKAPAGPVFFKCVGPQATMAKAQSAFRSMMYSLKKGS